MNFFKRIFGLLKFILMFVWLLLILLIGAKLAQQNPQLMQVDLLVWTTPEASAGVTLSVTLLTGVLLGVLAMLPSLLILKARLRKTRGKVAKVEQQRSLQLTKDPVLS